VPCGCLLHANVFKRGDTRRRDAAGTAGLRNRYFRYFALLDKVRRTWLAATVTRYGRPVARMVPCASEAGEADNPLQGSADFEDDVITPVPACRDGQASISGADASRPQLRPGRPAP
jgi:antitoxin (DNA-binding transcriptional repressor) of toxin-antitoxin stability system